MDAGCKPGVRVGLGLRCPARIRYRVSGPRCQVAGTRYLEPNRRRGPDTEHRGPILGARSRVPDVGYRIPDPVRHIATEYGDR
jgi:hypothetical protein